MNDFDDIDHPSNDDLTFDEILQILDNELYDYPDDPEELDFNE